VRRCVPVLLGLLAFAAPVHATVGGPTLLDVLGWSPAERRVYVRVVPMNAAGEFGEVLCFALDAPDPERPLPVPGLRGGENTSQDAGLLARLAALRERLVSLIPEPATALPERVTVVSADTARDCYDAVRYRMRARWEDGPELDVTCFHRPDVAVKGVYRVPGRRERLLVVSLIGHCEEGGYETQEPVFLANPAAKLRYVPWRGTG
jgi:hypothetical protein